MALACFLLTFDSKAPTDRARGTITVILNPNHLLCKRMDFKCSFEVHIYNSLQNYSSPIHFLTLCDFIATTVLILIKPK